MTRLFLPLVIERLFLDLGSLVLPLHRSQHSPAAVEPLELRQDRFLNEVGELFDDEAALERVFVLVQPELLVDDQLYCQRPAHRLLRRRGDRLVVSIGVKAVGVVIERIESLKSGADVVEADLLCMQRPPGGLDVVLELLRPLVAAVAVSDRLRPDTTGDTTDDRVFSIDPVGEEEGEIGTEVVDVHTSGQVVLHVRESVGQGEGEVSDCIRAGLGHVIPAYRDRVEVPDVFVDEVLLDVAHHSQRELSGEDAGVLGLVLLEDVGLNRSPNPGHGFGLDPFIDICGQHLITGDPKQPQPQSLVPAGQIALVCRSGAIAVDLVDPRLHLIPEVVLGDIGLTSLIDRSVHEEGEDHRRRPVDGHRHRRGRIGEVEPGIELLRIVEGGDRDPRVADLAVDVGTLVGVLAVEGHRVEGCGQALGRHALGQVVETSVGLLGRTFPSEHPCRVLFGPLEWENARRIGEFAGYVLLKQPLQPVAP